MIPKYARYSYCIQQAINFLLTEKINSFPYNCDSIISKHGWSKLEYSILAKKHNVSILDIINAFDSEDGYSIFNGKNYSIAYNDTQISKRVYFTKLHEVGHILLKHFTEFNETILLRSNLNKHSYKVLENEANCFARNVLAPAILVKKLNLNTPSKVSNCFGITYQAAKARLDLLNNDLKYISNQMETNLLLLFNKFIFKKHCLNCHFGFVSSNAKYCPICGHNRLIRGDGYMIYSGYELDDNGKALECPICKNQQFSIDGVYCKICGTYLINKCTNENGIWENNEYGHAYKIKKECGMIADGNARFCEYCGEPTTFYKQKLLSNWKESEIEITEQEVAGAEDYDEIPF